MEENIIKYTTRTKVKAGQKGNKEEGVRKNEGINNWKG
jgi:hypothetical protein